MKNIGYSKVILSWLFIGLIMIFIQVLVGGITRLTESGLSITKWEVISGTIPPVSDQQWLQEFDKYKATPQYEEVNQGMTLDDFKFIYFWEFIHRFWARIMGLVFIIPFIYFMVKGWMDKKLLLDLTIVFLLALLAATFGWIMVASGLVERPWVNAYKLSFHLLIAFSVYAALLWTYLKAKNKYTNLPISPSRQLRKLVIFVFGLFLFQLFLGGVLSGMKAAVVYPTWPKIGLHYFPDIIFDFSQWNWFNFNNYDTNPFMPALIHFLHRNIAYALFIAGIILSMKLIKIGRFSELAVVKNTGYFLIGALSLQVLIGVITVINSIGEIPVLWGVLHQAGALIILTIFVFVFFILRIKE